MGKKDDEIARLEKDKEILTKDRLNAEKKIETLKEEIDTLNATQSEALQGQQEIYNANIAKMQEQVQAMSERRGLMVLVVNTTGADASDYERLCDAAVELMTNRLEELGLKDKYNILAHPHTMALNIIG